MSIEINNDFVEENEYERTEEIRGKISEKLNQNVQKPAL